MKKNKRWACYRST